MLNLKPPRSGVEGIVSKRAGILERKSRQWLKSKNPAFVRT